MPVLPKGIPVISSMGAAGKLDPTHQATDLASTKVDPMAGDATYPAKYDFPKKAMGISAVSPMNTNVA